MIQQTQIIAIWLVTPVLMALLCYGGVVREKAHLQAIETKTADARTAVMRLESRVREAEQAGATLVLRQRTLARREDFLCPDQDPYDWIVSMIGSFASSHSGIKIDTYGKLQLGDVGVLPQFPYRWASCHITGTGYYQEIGAFFADLENTFKYTCIRNVVIVPDNTPGARPETVTVSFDLLTPILSEDRT